MIYTQRCAVKEYEIIKNEIERMLKPKRYKHSINVEKISIKLSKIYGADEDHCRVAAILHDCAKGFKNDQLLTAAEDYGINVDEIQKNSPGLLHGPVGAMYAKYNFGIENEDILNSIWFHTTGRAGMSKMEKIIYIADLIEEGRDFPGVEELRILAEHDLDKALILSCNSTINYVIERNELIHPLTIEFRNSLLLRGMHKNG